MAKQAWRTVAESFTALFTARDGGVPVGSAAGCGPFPTCYRSHKLLGHSRGHGRDLESRQFSPVKTEVISVTFKDTAESCRVCGARADARARAGRPHVLVGSHDCVCVRFRSQRSVSALSHPASISALHVPRPTGRHRCTGHPTGTAVRAKDRGPDRMGAARAPAAPLPAARGAARRSPARRHTSLASEMKE